MNLGGEGKSALIIGGSRFIGPRILRKLLERKFRVTVFNRGNIARVYPAGVELVVGDREAGFSFSDPFDIVIDMCAYRGVDTAVALRDLRFGFFIHMGTSAAYSKSEVFPLHENSPLGDWPVWGEYNKGKVECERVLEKSGVRYATIRPVYVLGTENHLNRERFIYQKVMAGESIVLPGNGEALAQFVFADEVAETVVKLAENQTAGAFNCAGSDYVTLRGLVEYMAELVGRDPVIGFNPNADGPNHNRDEFPFANENFVVANDRAKNMGVSFVPLFDGLKRDYEEYYKKVIE